MRSYLPLKQAFGFSVLACAGAVSPILAATTAVTDPVGFTTLSASNKSSSAGQFNYISLDLTRPIAFQAAIPSGGVTTDGTGHTVLTFPAGTFTAGQFSAPSYLEIGSGGNAGVVSDVIASTTSSVTLADNVTSAASTPVGNTVKIRPHWTFATAFGTPNASDPTAITGGASGTDSSVDVLSLVDPSTNTTRDYYYNTSDAKWERVTTNADATNDIIPIYAGVQLQRRSSTPANIVLVGAVKLGPTGIWVTGSNVDTTNLVSNPYPLPSVRLDQLGLYDAVNDPSAAVTLAGGSPTTADLLRILDPQTGILTDFYYDNSTGSYGGRWKTGFTDASLYKVPAGASATIIRRAGRPSFVWYAPQPAISSTDTPAALVYQSAVSRKVHTAGGLNGTPFTGDINLPLSGSVGTESRNPDQSGNYTVVFTFSNPISTATATVNSVASPTSISGNELSITAQSVANQQTIAIAASNVTDIYGQTLPSASASMRVLRGDINSSANINGSDVNIVKAQVGLPLTVGSYRADVNASGTFNGSDVNIIKSLVGTSTP